MGPRQQQGPLQQTLHVGEGVQDLQMVKPFPLHLLGHEEVGLHGVRDAQGEELGQIKYDT